MQASDVTSRPYLIQVRRIGPMYTYVVTLENGARPYSPSTGFFASEQEAWSAAHTMALRMLARRSGAVKPGSLFKNWRS